MQKCYGINAAALRQQVVGSSPELRALQSKLETCALTRYNKAAVAEKEAHHKLRNIREREYGDLVKQVDNEEKLNASLFRADQQVKVQQTRRVLEEQIADKAASKAKVAAENLVEVMAQEDASRVVQQQVKEQCARRQESQENTRQILHKQTQLRKLREEESKLHDKHVIRCAEEYNLKVELQKEMERQKTEIQQLQHHQQELALVHKLEKHQHDKDVIHDVRLELEILEKQAQEDKFAEEKEKRKEGETLNLMKELDGQVRYKKDQDAKQQEKDAEYKKLILEVMAEEGHLEQLVTRARKQRQLDHRQLVERLLQERRALRAQRVRQNQLQNHEEMLYEELRRKIIEEEEEQLLLQHAPHLMPHLTPELRARLSQLL